MFRVMYRVFDYSGRSTRWEYWSFAIGLVILLILGGAWSANYQNTHFGLSPQFSDDDALGIGFALFIFVVLPNLSLKVRRYHDFGWSGWAVLWTFVPLVNLFMELMLLFRGPTPIVANYEVAPEPQHITIYNTPGAGTVDPTRSGATPVDQIARLADMHAQGALTAQEFAVAKARVLRS